MTQLGTTVQLSPAVKEKQGATTTKEGYPADYIEAATHSAMRTIWKAVEDKLAQTPGRGLFISKPVVSINAAGSHGDPLRMGADVMAIRMDVYEDNAMPPAALRPPLMPQAVSWEETYFAEPAREQKAKPSKKDIAAAKALGVTEGTATDKGWESVVKDMMKPGPTRALVHPQSGPITVDDLKQVMATMDKVRGDLITKDHLDRLRDVYEADKARKAAKP